MAEVAFCIAELEAAVAPKDFPRYEDDFSLRLMVKQGDFSNLYFIYPRNFNGVLIGLSLHRTMVITAIQRPNGELIVQSKRYTLKRCIWEVVNQVFYNR